MSWERCGAERSGAVRCGAERGAEGTGYLGNLSTVQYQPTNPPSLHDLWLYGCWAIRGKTVKFGIWESGPGGGDGGGEGGVRGG